MKVIAWMSQHWLLIYGLPFQFFKVIKNIGKLYNKIKYILLLKCFKQWFPYLPSDLSFDFSSFF